MVDVRGPVPPFTIVGIVADVRETAVRDDPTEIVYIPVIEPSVELSIVPTDMCLLVRTQGPPLALAAAIRDAIAAVDPDLRVGQIRTMDSIVRAARARETFVGALLLLATAVSVFLGFVGVYGSVAHVVKGRTREIGIRMALGARRAEVIRMVTTGSTWAVLAGVVLGLAVALAGTGTLRALLFGVEPRDPVIFLAVTAVLSSAAMAATVLSALRATHADPIVALRDDN
jgi:predicted lysophospholipase L1 biosynthesis ABC-type transport system permease subunit